MKFKNLLPFIIVAVLSTIDMFSTMWLHGNTIISDTEVNPFLSTVLDNSLMFVGVKILILGVVLGALWKLCTQSEKAFKWGVRGTCAVWGLACVNNIVGVVLLW